MNEAQQKLIALLAASLAGLMRSCSTKLGHDCLLHALLAQRILTENGIETELAAGPAAWRVGTGDSDMITHLVTPPRPVPGGAFAMGYHAWLKLGDSILDFTTYSLPQKAAKMDEADGGKTSVEWSPEYLLVDKSTALSLDAVVQSFSKGVYFYEEVPQLLDFLYARVIKPLDEEDVNSLRLIMRHPGVRIYGPNDLIDADVSSVD